MNWVDITFLIALGSGAVWGVAYGFIRVGMAFGLLVAGTGIAGTVAVAVGPYLTIFGNTVSERTAAGFLLSFAFLMVAGAMVNFLIKVPLTLATGMVSVMPVANSLNRGGGLIAGVLFGCVLVSVTLIGLQQLQFGPVGKSIDEASFASAPIGWVDRFVASIEISTSKSPP